MSRYLQSGNGNKKANQEKVMNWFIQEFEGATLADNGRIKINDKVYHVTYSVEQKKIQLVGSGHGSNEELPAYLSDVDGTLILRQLSDGRLAGHRFEGASKLWDSKDAMHAISWEKAGPLTDEAIVRLFDDESED